MGNIHLSFDMDTLVKKILWCFSLLSTVTCRSSDETISNYKFPPSFMLGTATSAYQIEGAWNESGKGQNIWDTYVHDRYFIVDKTNGDKAADSYHQMEKDVEALNELGVHFYRFSVSWSRILPNGYINVINQDGIQHYNTFINLLLANNIIPVITMYHWDLPQPLQDLGGWANPLMADYFEDYAYVLFSNFGDRVKWWVTINEPTSISSGYNDSRIFAPGINSPGIGYYLSAQTLIHAHAKAYHLYNNEFRHSQQGQVGISVVGDWFLPHSTSEEDRQAAEDILEYQLGLFANPIYSKEGDYPEVVKQHLQKVSLAQGYRRSRLLKFTPPEISYIRGTYDFLGLNYYTSMVAKHVKPSSDMKFSSDFDTILSIDPNWPRSNAIYIQVVPWGFRKLLNWVKNKYNNVPVFVTENGFPDSGEIRDTARIHYIISHLNELLKAIHEDGCDVFAYTYWSLLDNFEWHEGYTQKFGLYHVDFQDPKRNRTPKSSSFVFSEIIRRKQLPKYYMEIDNKVSVNVTLVGDEITYANYDENVAVPRSSSGACLFQSRTFLQLCTVVIIYSGY